MHTAHSTVTADSTQQHTSRRRVRVCVLCVLLCVCVCVCVCVHARHTSHFTLQTATLSSILFPLSSILHPPSSILYPLSSILYPISSILYPISSILYPLLAVAVQSFEVCWVSSWLWKPKLDADHLQSATYDSALVEL